MTEAVIVAAYRTPIGRYAGALKDIRPDDLAAHVLKATVERSGLDPALIEDVILGCTNQAGEDNRNVARMAAVLAGFPEQVAGQTVNRLCGSGLQAVNLAAQAIWSGQGDLFLAGGTESMTRAPFVMAKPDAAFPRGEQSLVDTTIGWRFVNPRLAALHHPSAWARPPRTLPSDAGSPARTRTPSRWRASSARGRAMREGTFGSEIVAVPIPQRKGDPLPFAVDEHPRPDTTLEKLASLKPAFEARGLGDRGQRQRHQRWRGGAAGHVGRARARPGISADGADRLDRCGRRRPGLHGSRSDSGEPQGACPRGAHRRGPRPDRAQRGVRVAITRLHSRAGPRS